MLKLVTGVERHLELQISHQKELCEGLFCFFPFFLGGGGKVVNMCVCLFFFFFFIKKNEFKNFISLLEMVLQLINGITYWLKFYKKMLSCAHWL